MKIEKIAMPGLAELDAALAELGTTVATKVGRKAIRASADLLRDAWAQGAPYSPDQSKAALIYGHARENMRVGAVRPRHENAVVFKVTTGDAFWMYFWEFGTVNQAAKPTFRPIVESMKEQFVAIQVEVARAEIEKEAAKIRRRVGK